ncbi:hypothetical protein F2Q70_00024990 [Brassica cretica]|uniref:Uncharacterized protein n=1 Tax=Brassica cretica TaxID=69181 RepID=A0A8S9LBH1_BRACR|nr:hypothetical protein F2Q70_00024990 [Brassica cretica]
MSSGGFVLLGVCSRVSSGACDVGWVFSAMVLSDFVRDWSGGVALGFLSPHLIKLWGLGGSGRRLSTLSGSRFRRCFGPVPPLYMSLGFNGCTWSRVGELEAAIFSTLLGTTASSVTISSLCCRIVFSWEPCVSRFEDAFLSGSSRRLEALSVIDLLPGPSR